MNYDEIIIAIGGCGRYQTILLLVLGLTCLQASVDLHANIFMLFTPTMKCKDEVFASFTNSSGFQKLDECVLQRISTADNSSISTETIKCTSWKYDESVFRSSFVTEYDLVCDYAYLTTIIESLYFVGISVGMLIGILGDKYGRRKLILACAVMEVVTSVTTPLANHLGLLIMLRTARGLSQSIYFQGVILLFEMVPGEYRMMYSAYYWLFWPLGCFMTSIAAYLCGGWRPMKWVLSIPQIIYVTFLFLVPESPRWLMAQGRKAEALEVLRKIAKWNRCKELPPILQNPQQVNAEQLVVGSSDRMIDVFLKPNLRLKILSLWMILASIAFGYSALPLVIFSDKIFGFITYAGITELIFRMIAMLPTDYIGTRSTLAAYLFIGALSTLVTPILLLSSDVVLLLLIAFFGRMILLSVHQIAVIYVVEIFPTTQRGMGVFTTCMWAQLTTIISLCAKKLPWYIFLVSCLINSVAMFRSAILTFKFLPDTKGCPLPQTVEEAESFRHGNEKVWTWQVLAAEERALQCEGVPLIPNTAPSNRVHLEMIPLQDSIDS